MQTWRFCQISDNNLFCFSDFYNILFNEENLLDHYEHDDFIELSNSQTNKLLKKVVVWQEFEFLLPNIIVNEREAN